MKIYALILVGITLILIDSIAIKALLRSRELSKAYRFLFAAIIATAVTFAFFISFKAVLVLVFTVIFATIYVKIRYRFKTSGRMSKRRLS